MRATLPLSRAEPQLEEPNTLGEQPSGDCSSRDKIVERLRKDVRRLEEPRLPAERISSGHTRLDRLLPQGGFRRGSLIEWVGAAGAGASSFALLAAQGACREGRPLVVIDRQRRFYPPGAASLGIDLANVVVVHPRSDQDAWWATCQALDCRGVGAVLCWPQTGDSRVLRQWQLAAETGGTLGLLVRSEKASEKKRPRSTWSDVQLQVEPLARLRPGARAGNCRVRIAVTYCRGGTSGRHVDLEIHEETGVIHDASTESRSEYTLPVAPELADRPVGVPASAG